VNGKKIAWFVCFAIVSADGHFAYTGACHGQIANEIEQRDAQAKSSEGQEAKRFKSYHKGCRDRYHQGLM
jgi:hypothetical protein